MKLVNLTTVKEGAIRLGSRALLKGKKYSPEILVAVGLTTGVASIVMAVKATRKVDEILSDHNETLENIETALEVCDQSKYSKEDAMKDTVITYIQTGAQLAKLYAPAIALEAVSVASILAAYGIIKKRNLALVAAYNGLSEAFENYRKRIIEDFGEEYDDDVVHGVRRTKIKAAEVTEDGKKKKVDKDVVTLDGGGNKSPYARVFDRGSLFWKNNVEMNLLFLRTQQSYANDLLRIRGHLFLNEVYDMLDIPHTREGAVVGWILEKGKPNFVDFGIYTLENSRFINGTETDVWLDFNVDGLIFDKI